MEVHRIVRIAHICRRWRDLALNHKALWTTIDITGPRLAMYFLALSGDLHLRCVIPVNPSSGGYDVFSGSKKLIDKLSGRVSEIDFRLGNATVPFLAASDFFDNGSDFPQLRSVTVVGMTRNTCLLPFSYNPRWNLKTLKLMKVRLEGWAWNALVFSGLEILQLENCSDFPQDSLYPFLDALERCPILKVLHLHSSCPRHHEILFTNTPHKIVTLNQCQLFEIRYDSATVIANLMAHIALPPSATLDLRAARITGQDISLRPHMVFHVLPSNTSHLKPLQGAKRARLSCTPGNARIALRTYPDLRDGIPCRLRLAMDRVSPMQISAERRGNIMKELESILGQTIEYFVYLGHLDPGCAEEIDGWRMVLEQWFDLRTLSFVPPKVTTSVQDCQDILTFLMAPQLLGDTDTIPCPKLKYIKMQGYPVNLETLSLIDLFLVAWRIRPSPVPFRRITLYNCVWSDESQLRIFHSGPTLLRKGGQFSACIE
ncbi:hypothetical protein K474DRAFT_210990 [Panus rudis PR-1116 ss-1]|nr:hypothetical protein K474DRAFT_210990 [Panus rudis PR-1116 ss-1]